MTITHDIIEPKISNLNIAPGVQKQILMLQVSADNHIVVEMLHTRDYLLGHESMQ